MSTQNASTASGHPLGSRKEVPQLIDDPMTTVTPAGPADHHAGGTAFGPLA
jgi:hypothetical protein